MHFAITQYFTDDPAAYNAARAAALVSAFPDTAPDLLMDYQASPPVELVEAAKLPPGSSAEQREVDILKARALEQIESDVPLVAGETVSEDLFSMLAKSWGALDAGTAVLRRRTNLAETCFFFPTVRILSTGLRVMPAPSPPLQMAAPLQIEVNDVLTSAAKMLLSQLGSAILAELFPDNSVPPYFAKVYAEIARIIDDALTRETVDHERGLVKAKLLWMNTQYTPKKTKRGPPIALLRQLEDQANKLMDSVSVLMEPRYANNGFPVFMLGATIHLCMLNEINRYRRRAEADPSKLQSIYAAHARATLAALQKARADQVVAGEDRDCRYNPGTKDVVCTPYLYWKDKITGAHKEYPFGGSEPKKADATKTRNAERTAHQTAVKAQLAKDLDHPAAIADLWDQIDL